YAAAEALIFRVGIAIAGAPGSRVRMKRALGFAQVFRICYPAQRTGGQRLSSRHIYRGVRAGMIDATVFGALDVDVPYPILPDGARRYEIADARWILQNR